MENAIYIAEPTKEYTTLLMLLLGLVTLLVLLYFTQNRKIKQLEGAYRQIVLLLGGLSALILFSATLFSAWNLYTIQPVKVFETYLETFHGKTTYEEIKRVGIYNDKQQSLINSALTIREDNILVLERKDKKVMMFAEDNYELVKLLKNIKEQQGKASKKGN